MHRNQLIHDGKVLHETAAELPAREFLKSCYTDLEIKYPKFHKMDLLSRFGILAGELLIGEMDEAARENFGVVLSNKSSSLQIDDEFTQTIIDEENFFPSPSLFVYTLPNIVIGEICIRHKLKGENAFFILDKFDPCFLFEQVEWLISTNRMTAGICGWVEVNRQLEYEACFFKIENMNSGKTETAFSAENLDAIFQKHIPQNQLS